MNYLYSKYESEFNSYFEKDFLQKTAPEVETVNQAIILPGGFGNKAGVYDKDGKYVQLSTNRYVEQVSELATTDYPYDSRHVIYLGDFGTRHYGNFLIDYLSRLWYLPSNAENVHYIYTGVCNLFDFGWMKRILSSFGLSETSCERICSPQKFSSVIIPQLTLSHEVFINEKYSNIFERLYSSFSTGSFTPYDNIYLTRTRLKHKKEIGEYVFEEFFRDNGYKIIAPETLSLEEQAFIVRNCKVIASIEGTHAHNIAFKGNSRLPYRQIILRKQRECIPRQIQLNQVTNGDAVWIDVWKEPFKGFPISHDRGPFLIEWNENMTAFARDNGMTIPEISFAKTILLRIEYCFKCLAYFLKHQLKRVYLSYKQSSRQVSAI